uniref:NADH dehydrogenase subunit 6 n=1 Tax=Capsala martinieri TaxID=119074 RepID=UPI002008ECDA|nr:NADH dehydrogenase subunit 6 [Capsala martinieri]UOX29715.1 NADH dehydrogenase subunit 6 [Capsala martinieri]
MVLSLSFYFFFLSLFSFVSNSVGYCILLVMSSLCISLSCFFFSGESWYSLILYLVYIGGVYILFIFISIHIPNTQNAHNVSVLSSFYILWVCIESCGPFVGLLNMASLNNYSFYLCSSQGGLSYLFICCFLVLGFTLVSFVSSSKDGFLR